MKTAQPLPPLFDRHSDTMDRMSSAWLTHRHLLVITHAGINPLTPARYLAASEPGPISFVDRWVTAVVQRGLRVGGIQDGPAFRAPHHTVSSAGMFGGGGRGCMRPGEVTLAHRGVLYLDDVAEFSRAVMHGLCEVLDRREVTHYRNCKVAAVFPADFRLIATAHACPCGFLGHPTRCCTDSASAVRRHRRRMHALASRPDVAVVDLTRTVGGHCSPECRGWCPSHSDEYGVRIERCDECAAASATSDTYHDENAEQDAAAWVASEIAQASSDPEVDRVIAALRGTSSGRAALRDACHGLTPEQAREGVALNRA